MAAGRRAAIVTLLLYNTLPRNPVSAHQRRGCKHAYWMPRGVAAQPGSLSFTSLSTPCAKTGGRAHEKRSTMCSGAATNTATLSPWVEACSRTSRHPTAIAQPWALLPRICGVGLLRGLLGGDILASWQTSANESRSGSGAGYETVTKRRPHLIDAHKRGDVGGP